MKKCKKCNIYLAMPGSDYCASCNPSGMNIYQGQIGSGPQQQAQNIGTAGISVSQQQSQESGGIQQQSFSTGENSNKPVMEKLNDIHRDVKYVKKDLSNLVEYQISQYENLRANLEKLTASENQQNMLLKTYKSTGNLQEAEKIQKQIEFLRREIHENFTNLDSQLNDLTETLVNIIEKQDITEEFLRNHLTTDWEYVKDFWREYKSDKIPFKEFIKKTIKVLGSRAGKNLIKKLLATATGGMF